MIEHVIFFGLGYVLASILRPKLKTDMLLYWDKDCFGWRPVANPSRINVHGRYIAALEIDPRTYVPNTEWQE